MKPRSMWLLDNPGMLSMRWQWPALLSAFHAQHARLDLTAIASTALAAHAPPGCG